MLEEGVRAQPKIDQGILTLVYRGVGNTSLTHRSIRHDCTEWTSTVVTGKIQSCRQSGGADQMLPSQICVCLPLCVCYCMLTLVSMRGNKRCGQWSWVLGSSPALGHLSHADWTYLSVVKILKHHCERLWGRDRGVLAKASVLNHKSYPLHALSAPLSLDSGLLFLQLSKKHLTVLFVLSYKWRSSHLFFLWGSTLSPPFSRNRPGYSARRWWIDVPLTGTAESVDKSFVLLYLCLVHFERKCYL